MTKRDVAIRLIKSKYKESFKIEDKIVKLLQEKSKNTYTISNLYTHIDILLTDIDILAWGNNITKEELDLIFSEVYTSE